MTIQDQRAQMARDYRSQRGSVEGMVHGPRREPMDMSGQDWLDFAALTTAPIPVLGDVAGLAADASMLYNEPESRTPLNVTLAALGLIPGVPAASSLARAAKGAGKGAERVPTPSEAREMARVAAEAKTVETRGQVPTRFPTAKSQPELQEYAGVSVADLTPKQLEQDMKLISKYPATKSRINTPTEKARLEFMGMGKENLLRIYDNVPESVRTAGADWYDGAHSLSQNMAQKYAFHNQPDAAAGVLAVMSPQKDWYQNVSLADRVMDIYSGNKGVFTPDMMNTFNGIKAFQTPVGRQIVSGLSGKSLMDLTEPVEKAMWIRLYDQTHNAPDYDIIAPTGKVIDVARNKGGAKSKVAWGSLNEIAKAVSVMDDPSIENISRQLGKQHKVRNFFNNINSPGSMTGDVTIDTHAVGAALFRPLSGKSPEVLHNFGMGAPSSSVTGVGGTYPLYADLYREAAAEAGVLPRQMQSVTWEGIRGLFPAAQKSRLQPLVDEIWTGYRKGQFEADEARSIIEELAGGYREPTWN